MKNKKAVLWDSLGPWIIAVAVLVLMFIIYILFSKGGQEIIQYLKDLLRFGK
jgi:ACR3 family arsenite efflux pump ArsB